MGKHSKKRKMNESDSEDEYHLRKAMKIIQFKLAKMDEKSAGSSTSVLPVSSARHRERSREKQKRRERACSPKSPLLSDSDDGRMQTFPDERYSTIGDGIDIGNEIEELRSVTPSAVSVVSGLEGAEVSDEVMDSHEEAELNPSVLSMLGYEVTPTNTCSPPVLKEIAICWMNILQKGGLTDEDRSGLISKYSPPENCSLLGGPKLNPEVAAASREVVRKRDSRILDFQNQISSALSALGQVLSKLIADNKQENNSHIQNIGDASRLLLDFHAKQSRSRRELVLLDLKKEVKEVLSSAPTDEWLFGEKLGDRLKASKEVERSGLDLRQKTLKRIPLKAHTSNHLNFKGPPRFQGDYRSGQRQNLNPPNGSNFRKTRTQDQRKRNETGRSQLQYRARMRGTSRK